MNKKAFVLQNKGMNRDLSISKVGESSAYENHNIRILARDHDTLLSVTNERGNREVDLTDAIEGTLLGWNVLNNHIILFTHDDSLDDRIYRIDYEKGAEHEFVITPLFVGKLGFDNAHPIESVVYFESDDVQKIYWLDGIHVLRFMNFMAEQDEIDKWNADPTYFDSNREAHFDVSVSIEKDNSGTNRPNGVMQYLLTYFNKHGQESGYVWVSDLVYLSPLDHGGPADGTNVNCVRLKISNLDIRFSHFRVYSIFRSMLDGTVTAYLVEEGNTTQDTVSVVDDGAHLTLQDQSRLLYLGSQPVHAWTLEHKDQTLFLGNLESVGHDYSEIERVIKRDMFSHASYNLVNGKPWLADCIVFDQSSNSLDGRKDIPYVENESTYPYENQLKYTSAEITTFKGGEKYRFALKFQLADGTESPAFWIGDKVNTLYPEIDESSKSIHRAIAYCILPDTVVRAIKNSGLNIKTVQLCIAEATYADRSVKAQGILNPTMFNTWDRYNKRTYAIPSWISRPRGAGYANKHFQSVNRSTLSTGEIQCSWWEDGYTPTPYYNYQGGSYSKEYGGQDDYNYIFLCYQLCEIKGLRFDWDARVWAFKIILNDASASLAATQHRFTDAQLNLATDGAWKTIYSGSGYSIKCFRTPLLENYAGLLKWGEGPKNIYNDVVDYLRNNAGLTVANDEVVDYDVFYAWCDLTHRGIGLGGDDTSWFSVYGGTGTEYKAKLTCMNGGVSATSTPPAGRWKSGNMSTAGMTGARIPAFATKHTMFVDENIITLNSPELEYEAVLLDNMDLKLRIIGLAKITSGISDFTVIADAGKKPGENLVDDKFSWTHSFGNKNGLIAWPLWEDRDLGVKPIDEDDVVPEERERTSEDYQWGGTNVKYWLHMWNHAGSINGYIGEDYMNYGFLNRKVFSNLKFSYETKYAPWGSKREYTCDMRHYNYLSSQYVYVDVGGENKFYNGNVQMSLLPPWKVKYPLLHSVGEQDTNLDAESDSAFLYSQEPVQIEFLSSPHAVLALKSERVGNAYYQTILPRLFNSENPYIPSEGNNISGAIVPWLDENIYYRINQGGFPTLGLTQDDMYLFVGELYQDYPANADTRYGGITETDIANCRFIPAGPQFLVDEMHANGNDIIYANQGDTYFQRWDCLKTKPFSEDSVNNVIDITSVMLETHLNIDGRTDLQRGIDQIASINTTTFGKLNPVYSQRNNYRIQRDLDDDYNTDAFRSTLTWTLPKENLADVDEWTHITLASSLNLDGDKGDCNAIRRFQNNLIAFQDRGISEILFNSRTQLSTNDGVPVEIANSGKVDGKRYITNHFGCTNKWSIVEGKSGLYFVDNINKSFCGATIAANGRIGVTPLSENLGFGVWFKKINILAPWEPVNFQNVRSFYDKVNADVYLVKGSDDDMACLVYNENLGAFTSFFDYGFVPMMVNVDDRFLSFKNSHLWLQNEGHYCNFFGNQYDYWIQYRVTPNPYTDKIWTNLEYRADFYDILDENGNAVVPEQSIINGDIYGEVPDLYKENETFDTLRIWNEYQTTGDIDMHMNTHELDPVRKRFRIWRVVIPRALKKEDMTKRTLDRIRNPWINLMFKKHIFDDNASDLMQLHDLTVTYFE